MWKTKKKNVSLGGGGATVDFGMIQIFGTQSSSSKGAYLYPEAFTVNYET